MSQTNATFTTKKGVVLQNKKSYEEIIEYLNANWHKSAHSNIQRLNLELGNPATKIIGIIISGTSGKSSTIYYLKSLLEQKNISVGTFMSPHVTSYNERLCINNQIISNEQFTLLANQVINLAQQLNLTASSKDILTAMALLHFSQNNVDVAIFEATDIKERDPVTICTPVILGISRIVQSSIEKTAETINHVTQHIAPTTYVISADQSKASLQIMAQRIKQHHGIWVMPIRKVAPLPYPFEQLFGRNAALADRIAHIYFDHFYTPQIQNIKASPSLPVKIYQLAAQFWKSYSDLMPHRFQIIPTKTKTIILDSAHNLDAFENLFLGIRLLNYRQPYKTVSFIFDISQIQCDQELFMKLFRSCFKKFSGTIAICRLKNDTVCPDQSWDINTMLSLCDDAKIKAIFYQNFQTAFHELSQHAHSQQDFMIIAGSSTIIAEYLKIEKIA
jgi:folylpolyglutamate synthase/dihydrofolate synthase